MKQTITIDGWVPMLNGSKGLINMHWSERRRLKEAFTWQILAQSPEKHEGKVNIRLTRYSSKPPDCDNLAASGKLPLDALCDASVIEDDSMEVIEDYSCRWRKSGNKNQRTEIEIEDI